MQCMHSNMRIDRQIAYKSMQKMRGMHDECYEKTVGETSSAGKKRG